MRVDIFVDVVCPWCFIGKRRLERALAMRPELAMQKAWRPFQLNPDMPAGGVPADEFFAEKFGSPELVAERRGMVAEIGAVGRHRFRLRPHRASSPTRSTPIA